MNVVSKRREPRMPRGPMEDRVASLGAVLDVVLKRIDTMSPMSATSTSPVDVALAPKRDQIVDALERGFAPGTIARMLTTADAPFAQETLRLGIVRIRNSAKFSVRSESRRRRDVVTAADAFTSRTQSDGDAKPLQILDRYASRPQRDSNVETEAILPLPKPDEVAASAAVPSRRESSVSSIAHLNSDV